MNRSGVLAIVFCAWLAAISAAAIPGTTEPPALMPGKPMSGEISGGDLQLFRIPMSSGQYARVVVNQKDADVALTLRSPSGKSLVSADAPSGERSPERISVIADESGDYLLEVRSNQKDARKRRYEASLEALRPATTSDRDRIEGERLFLDGERLRADGSGESLRGALERYEASLLKWRAAGDPLGEARCLRGLGWTRYLLGEFPRAAEDLERALVVARAAAEPYTLAAVLMSLGATRDALSEPAKSLTAYEEALKFRRDVGDRRGEAAVLLDIGQVYAATGDPAKGLEYDRKALDGMREAGDAMGEATVLNGMGAAQETLGERRQALELYGRARRLFHEAGNSYGEGIALQNLGRTFASVGEMQKALESLFEALPLSRANGDRAGESYALTSIGAAYTSLGEPQTGMKFLEKALPMVRETGDRTGEASTLDCIGAARTALEDHAGALEAYEKARVILHEAGIRPGEAYILTNMGARYEALGRTREALDALSGSLALMREIGDRSGEAFALAQTGSIEASQGRRDVAAEHLRQALQLHRETGNPIGEVEALDRLARVQRDGGDLSAARDRIEEALGVIESLRTRVASRSLQQSYFATMRDSYDLAIDVLMRLHRSDPARGFDRLALRVSERSRARVLLELLTQAAGNLLEGADNASSKRQRTLEEKILALMERQKGLASAERAETERSALQKELDDVTAEYERLEAQARASDPRYAALSDPQPLTAEEIQAEIGDDDTALLEYSLGKERSYLWVVTRDEVSSYELGPASEIEAAAREVHAKIAGGSRSDSAAITLPRSARRLSDMLWKSAAASLHHRRWVIVPDGAVEFVPFSALPEPSTSNPLVSRHEIVTLPSASSLAALRREIAGRRPAEKTLAILADPVFDRKDPRVVASLWRVDDVATAELMKRFYQAMLGPKKMPPAAALRDAQVWMRRQTRWRSPYYWAGFVLQGEWR